MSRQIETNYFNPDLLLAKEAFRDTVCDITGTEGSGELYSANLNYTSTEEVQN